MAALFVYRDYRGVRERVGRLVPVSGDAPDDDGTDAVFSYDRDYIDSGHADAIATTLRLKPSPFTAQQSRLFFSALVPGGVVRKMLAAALKVPVRAYVPLLARLNYASSGALMFCDADEGLPGTGRLEAVRTADLESFASQPHILGLRLAMRSHLGISGEQFKLALYHEGENPQRGWYLPNGGAPSTHIVKAPARERPWHTLNEALCMRTAELLGLPVARSFLVSLTAREPLLAVERFDRPRTGAAQELDGHPLPARLQQESFCQALALPEGQRDEDAAGAHLQAACRLVNAKSANPLADRIRLFKRLVFDFLVGNCDNGLSKHALLWDADWRFVNLAPAYDLACTTIYDDAPRGMGMGFSATSIDAETPDGIRACAAACGVTAKLGWSYYRKLAERLPEALEQAASEIERAGFARVRHIARFIAADARKRSFR